MSAAEWAAVGAVLAILMTGLPVIRHFATRHGASPEVARKSVHVAMGLACATFPWIFHRPLPVVILAVIATLPLTVIRTLPRLRDGIGSALHGIKRPSYGEVLFAPAVALVFVLAGGDRDLYLIPVLILTLADAAGALVGTRWGIRRYGSGEGFKTIEGSLIFWLAAFLCGFLPLLQCSRVDPAHALWIGLILGMLAMMAEGISDRGFDNLVIPLGCCLLLERLLPLEIAALAWRFAVLTVLLVVVVTGSRWSTLNGGALLGGVLLGYGCAIIADWRFAMPLLAVFVCHLVTTRRHGFKGRFDHRLDAVLSHMIAGMPWVFAAAFRWIPVNAALAGMSFAMGAQLAMLDTSTRAWIPNLKPSPVISTTKGILIATLPGLSMVAYDCQKWLGPATLAVGTVGAATLIFCRIRPGYRGHATGLWILQGLLALASSIPALLIRS